MSDLLRYPSIKQLEKLYEKVVKQTGGGHGYLSRANLEYILDTVRDVGERLPRGDALIRKAAFLLFNFVTVHPLINGNKRTAYELVRIFIRLNGSDLNAEADDAYRFLLRIAQGKASMKDVEAWIARHLTDRRD